MRKNDIDVDYVIEINVDDAEIIKRMSGRRAHLASGRTYHIVYNPPKQENIDDITGEPLVQREDDKEETVKHRLDVYHEQTEPLIDYYRQFSDSGEVNSPTYAKIAGVGSVEDIKDAILKQLGA